jgi:hypothetical protein
MRSTQAEGDGAGQEGLIHTDEHEQPGGSAKFPGQVRGGGRDIHSSRVRLHCPLGKKHPSTLTSMSNLALILHIEEKDLATRGSQAGTKTVCAGKMQHFWQQYWS